MHINCSKDRDKLTGDIHKTKNPPSLSLPDHEGLVSDGPMGPITQNEAGDVEAVSEKLVKSLAPTKNPLPPNFTDFEGLMAAVPLGPRTLREEIKKGRIPTIRLPGGRRLLFHLPSVERALLRFQRGGIE